LSLYRHLRLAPLLALGSWFFTTHCSDPLADDCTRTLKCPPDSEGTFTLGPDCVWRYPSGMEWFDGPRQDSEGVWRWNRGAGDPVGRDFECKDEVISVGGSGGSGGSGGAAGGNGGSTAGVGGDGMTDAGPPPEPPPPTPDCRTNLECAAPTQCDESTGNCVGCVDDIPCAGTIAPRCSEGTCVACVENTDCTTPGFSRCDLDTNTCQPCTDTEQCAHIAGANQCNPTLTGGKCVQCLTEAQCTGLTGTEQCKEETGQCVRCTADEHCAGDRDNPRCDLNTNTCAACADDEQCPDAFPICKDDVEPARCVACLGNQGQRTCQDPNVANCSPTGECGPCTNSNQCTHLGADLDICNLANGRCVECVNDDDCDSVGESRCDLNTNTCVECTRNGATSIGCGGAQPGGTVCDTTFNPNRCVQCTGTDFAACAVGGTPRVCDSIARTCTNFAPNSAARCGECVSDAQCPIDEVCVQETLGTTNFKFCIPEAAATPPPCAGLGPNRIQETVNSLDATNVSVCSTVSTCPARADLIAGTICTVNANCGAQDVDDGICATTSQGLKCNIVCNEDADCGGTRTCLLGTPQICSE
jgi:hypothetical protein